MIVPRAESPLISPLVLQLGSLGITQSVVTTLGSTLLLVLAAWLATRVALGSSSATTTTRMVLEAIVTAMRDAVAAAVPAAVVDQVLPFVATLWLFLVTANLVGIVPGLRSPTGDLSCTAALALVVFGYVHWLGIRTLGVRAYLRRYLYPSPFLVPFEIISEITRTVTLAVRLFGNIMSLEIAAMMVVLLAGVLVPIPFLMLHVVEAVIQAYIFGMLALVYVGAAVTSQKEVST